MTTSAERPILSTGIPHWMLGVCIVVAVVSATTVYGPAIAAFTTLCVLSLVLLLAAPENQRPALTAAFCFALALRLVAAVWLTEVHTTDPNPSGLLFRDSFGYHRVGTQIAQMIHDGTTFRVEYHTTGLSIPFHRLVGTLYAWLGVHAGIAKSFSAVLGAILVLLTYAFARPIVGGRVAMGGAWMYALWPTAIFWSAQILKDTLVGFLLILASLCWVRFVKARNYCWVLLAAVVIAPLIQIRNYSFAFMLLGLFVGVLWEALSRRRLVLAAVIASVPLLTWSIPFKMGLVDEPSVILYKLSLGASLSPGSMMTTLAQAQLDQGLLLSLAMVKFLVSPLPWNASGMDLYTVPGIVLQYAILPFAVRGGFLLLRDRVLWVIPFVILTFFTDLIHAVVFFGAVSRHMHMFYPYMFVCAMWGIIGWRHWAFYYVGFFLAGLVGLMLMLAATR